MRRYGRGGSHDPPLQLRRVGLRCVRSVLPTVHFVDCSGKNLPDGPAAGASVDRFIYEGAGITAVSFRYSGLRARRVGSEIGVSLFPDALSAGSLYLATDLGGAYSAPGDGFSLLFKGGVSTLTALGGGFAFEPGFHFGTGMIVQTGKRASGWTSSGTTT